MILYLDAGALVKCWWRVRTGWHGSTGCAGMMPCIWQAPWYGKRLNQRASAGRSSLPLE